MGPATRLASIVDDTRQQSFQIMALQALARMGPEGELAALPTLLAQLKDSRRIPGPPDPRGVERRGPSPPRAGGRNPRPDREAPRRRLGQLRCAGHAQFLGTLGPRAKGAIPAAPSRP